ncbi:MAG: sugar phosphate isomerase/epimerase [Thermoguttaceae bacterium]|nr:sugar phosphate isomerase/epimerase [Thermoguttaceae bacterium]
MTEEEKKYKTRLHCAALVGEIDAKEIEALAAAGYEGVETRAWNVDVAKAREGRRIAEANGIKIHSVMCSGTFTQGDDVAKSEAERLKGALRIAAEYGASAMLVVPGRVDDPGIRPWEFDIEFDPETLLVSKVVKGDNAPYAGYIKAQNDATLSAVRNVPRIASAAAYEGVTVGLENVWNNLWVAPEFLAAFIHSFDNVRIKSYFDLGNHVKYSPTPNWLRALGKNSIVKLHFKDFLLTDHTNPHGGRFVPIGQGSNDWTLIRQTLDDIGYSGFATMEFEEQESLKFTAEQNVRKFKNFFNGVDINDGV